MPARTLRPTHRPRFAAPLAAALVASLSVALPAALPVPASAAPNPLPGAGFHTVAPTRVVDTRDGTGSVAAPLAALEPRMLTLTGTRGIPANGVVAVVANLTVTATTATSHLTAWPADEDQPTASNLNWPAGDTRANLALLPVPADGRIQVVNNAGTAHLIVDVVGWFDTALPTDPGLHTLAPTRIVDTRDGTGTDDEPLGAGQPRTLSITGRNGIPLDGVTAIVANLTVAGGTAPSHLTAWPADAPKPTASNLNWPAGDNRANLAVLPLSADGDVIVENNAGTAELIVDVVGWFDTSTPALQGLHTTAPVRLVDTRDGTGTYAAPLTSDDIRTVKVAGVGPVPDASTAPGVTAVIANLTVTGTDAGSHLTAWSADRPMPLASNLNWPAGDTRANLAVLPVAPDGTIDLFQNEGRVDVIVDVVGWFTGPSLDVRIDGVGIVAGTPTIRVVPRGFTPTTVELALDSPDGVAAASGGAPFALALDTTTLTNGAHVVHARAMGPQGTVVGGQAVEVDNRPYDWGAVDATMQQKVDSIPVQGNVIFVAHHGAEVHQRPFGTYTPTSTVFIASATKWMSGATLMRLVDKGLLRLDTTVGSVLSEFNGAKSGITLRQLMSFTSGLQPDPACAGATGMALAQCAAALAALPLRATPGSEYWYGSGHLVVAARMAEVVTGKPWTTIVADELTIPLGLTATGYPDHPNPNPAGSSFSNMVDYSRFLRMMWNHGEIDGVRFLSPAAVEQMQRDQTRGATMKSANAGNRRYGLAQWFDLLDPAAGAAEITSPGAFGFLPWIDRQRDVVGVYVVLSPNKPGGGTDVKVTVRTEIDRLS